MSPIFVRPVREQLEHDRVIRLLQARWRRRYQVAANQGAEQNEAVTSPLGALYPDLVLSTLDRGHRLEAVVEVETDESVNNLEALAQWAAYAKLRTRFELYVPAPSVEAARRLCAEHNIAVSEIWSFHTIGDQIRFNMAYRAPAPPAPAPRRSVTPRARRAAAPGRKTATRRPAKAAKRVRPKNLARKTAGAQKRK